MFLRVPARLVAFLGVALGARRKRFGRDTFAPPVPAGSRDDDVRWVCAREAVVFRRLGLFFDLVAASARAAMCLSAPMAVVVGAAVLVAPA